jgi:hypothetical protein
VAKLAAGLLATVAFWARIQTSLKNTKWATLAKEWPTNSSPPKNIQKVPVRQKIQALDEKVLTNSV